MDEYAERNAHVAIIDKMIRHITWQSHKEMLHTLSRPEVDLTMPQTVTLFAIRGMQTCRMSELAEMTHQSAGTLTGIVDRLIEENLVGRVRDVDDRRVVQVTLTAEGENRLTLVEHLLHEEMGQRLRAFNNEQLHHFSGLLGLLMQSFQEQPGHELAHASSVAI
jgi:DNA-binding MarR family transcriptional regulator